MAGNVVNVNALLTGNATSLVGAATMGSKAMGELGDAYKRASGAAVMSSAETQAAMAKASAAAQAQATAARIAAQQATAARELAAAKLQVAMDKEATAHAKAAAAATTAAQAKARANALGMSSMQAAADAEVAAAQRAVASANEASAQKQAAMARVAAATNREADAIAKALDTEEKAVSAAARAHQLAHAQKIEAMEKVSGAYAKASAAIIGGAALVGIGAVTMAADFEKSTMRLHTSGGQAMSEVEKMRDGILVIAQTTGTATGMLADGMYEIVSGGFEGAEALNILKAAAQGAKAEGADLTVMTKGLTSIMAAYGIPADQAVQTTNALTAASGLAKVNLQEFTNSLSTVLPTAAAASIGFAEVSAATAVLTQNGTSAAEATQDLKALILSLQNPTDASARAMDNMGISATEVSQMLGTQGLGATINYLNEKVLASKAGNEVLVSAFNNSRMAASQLNNMIGNMPPQLAEWSKQLQNGEITTNEYARAINTLGVDGETMGRQFMRLIQSSGGFNEVIRRGGPETQTYLAVMQDMLGQQNALDAALVLTGSSQDAFTEGTKRVADAQKMAGDNVASHAATQSTVAAAWDRMRATAEVLAIQLGNVLLPAAAGILETFSGMVKFFQENSAAAEALGLGIAAIAGAIITTTVAMKAYLAIQAAMTIATTLATVGWHGLNAAMRANLFGIIITAIAALVAGVIWAYDNIGWFKDGVDAAFKWIGEVVGGFVSWIQTDFVPFITEAWTNVTNVWNEACRVIGEVMTWLWENIISPIWDFISTSFKVGLAVIMFVASMIDLAIKGVATVIVWLYENIVKPNWDLIALAISTVWNWLVKNVFEPWGVMFKFIGDAVVYWWKTVVEPTWAAVQIGIAIVWNWLVKNVFEPWGVVFENIGKAVTFWWENVVRPAWDNLMNGISTVWNWLVQNVFDPWMSTTDNMGKAFEAAGKIIEDAWKTIQNAAREPIRFLIEEVYTKGIQATWNGIAESVGLDWRLADIGMPFANGGVVPGFANGGIPAFHGGGVMSGYSPGIDDRLIAVGGGEAVMRPEWTRMVGPNGVAAMNAMARANDGQGVRAAMSAIGATGGAFADGGIVGDVLGNLGNFFADVGKNAMDLIGGVASFLSDPIGGVVKAVGGVVNSLLGGIPGAGGGFVNAVSEIPPKIVQGIADKAVQLVQTLMASMAGAGGTPGAWDGSGGALAFPAPGAVLTQGFHAGHNGVDLANALGSPVISAEQGVVSFAGWSGFGGGNEVHIDHPNGLQTWYAHLNGFAVGAGQSVGRAQLVGPMGSTGNSTGPHVHFMVLNGGWPAVMDPMGFFSAGGIVPTFDSGGTLKPGINVVNNATGSNEPVAPTKGLAKEIAEELAKLLGEITIRIDGKSFGDYVYGRLILATQKKAGSR